MKKFVNIKGVLDNIRQSVNTPSPTGGGTPGGPVRLEQDICETLSADKFTVENTLRHGFPFKPTCMAFDPIQKLLAIGNRTGCVRIFGRPGIDYEIQHDSDRGGDPPQVMQVEFIINQGRLLTACTDNSINLWEFKTKQPELLQTLKLNKERLVLMQLEFQDKWLYFATERGNVMIINLETFTLSGYQINWNKCMGPLDKNHPGTIVHLSVNPVDTSKLLIGFETGLICLWDLSVKKADQRFCHNRRLLTACWHLEGRQFVAGYSDGSLITWSVKANNANGGKSVQFPHKKKDKETNKMTPCGPIEKVLWRVNRNGGDYFVFSGGLPTDVTGVTPSITIIQGKNSEMDIVEMENSVLDFLLATDSPYMADYQDPEAVIVMLSNDLVALDCKSSKIPCFKNPYAMDFNESPVTFCHYLVDCPGDLIPNLYMVGSKAKKEGSSRGFSSGEWPISGGVDTGAESCSYSELVVTGHADGSVRFWDSSSTTMQALYRVKTAKYFERTKKAQTDGAMDEDPYQICHIILSPTTRELAVAGISGQVLFFRFKKKETTTETKSMDIPIVYEVSSSQGQSSMRGADIASPATNQHFEFPTPKPLLNVASQSAAYTDPVDGFNFDKPQYEYFTPLRLRAGAQRKNPGYHAELICMTPWVNNEAPTPISCLTLSSNFGLMAYGNGSGIVIVDVVQFQCLLNMGTADLYGALDPFQRMPKSPKFPDSGPDIVRVDLSNYNQVGEPSATTPNSSFKDPAGGMPSSRAVDRVKTPETKKLLQKAGSSADDSSMSKSHSSSMNSLDQMISSEGVTMVAFADSFSSKNDFTFNSCLYVGTSLGSLIAIIINLPDRGEARLSEPVVVSPSGSLYRLRGAVLTTCFLDASSSSLKVRGDEAPENVHIPSRPSHSGGSVSSNQASSPPIVNQGSQDERASPGGSNSPHSGDQQIMIVCTEKGAASYALPSQRQMYQQTINESCPVVCAKIINFGGSKYTPCLVAYTADGFIKAYSLPSLRPMMDVYFIALSSERVRRTMSFSNYGHGMFLCNATEVQKFTISSEFARQLPDMQGSVFQDGIPMPEPPKPSFLKGLGLFGGTPKPLDREELFGETAGKAPSHAATVTMGASMQAAQSKAINTATEVGRARQGFEERGQRLNELEDRTEAMANEAKQYASNAHTLMLAAKNKKWYQL